MKHFQTGFVRHYCYGIVTNNLDAHLDKYTSQYTAPAQPALAKASSKSF
jgi:hypothetical protein